ncbi:MAG: Zn-ribbon domain-containing OB-fold protein [Devosia sp.]|nr:Zn-ribbon domain-containing OB-fold protein [Devosia sp.]
MTTTSDTEAEASRWVPEMAPWRAAAAQGRLLVKHCDACGKAHYYPRAICPLCFSDQTCWRESAGRGTLYSFSVQRRVAQPYVIAYVTLGDGPTIMTHIVDCDDPERLRIGANVVLDMDAGRQLGAPVFRIAAGANT